MVYCLMEVKVIEMIKFSCLFLYLDVILWLFDDRVFIIIDKCVYILVFFLYYLLLLFLLILNSVFVRVKSDECVWLMFELNVGMVCYYVDIEFKY